MAINQLKALPLGSDFIALRIADEIYVDKTEMVFSLVVKRGKYFLARPRRFGKSVTANMLTAYYSRGCNSEAMFADLEISKNTDFKKHLNQYDVIHLDIQWCMEPAGGAEQVVLQS